MDRDAFAEELRRQVVLDLRRFREAHPGETPYGYGLLGEPGSASYLASVVATEDGLQRVAAKYLERGYQYGDDTEVTPGTHKVMAAWLRWANPDDGWYFWGLPDHERVQADLAALVDEGGLGEDGKGFEEFCTDVLASLPSLPEWQAETARGPVVVGFTTGSDPHDFLRTATRANPYPVVRRLWAETHRADELRRQITSPSDRRP